ncbi:MAG: phosphoribosyltransferase family protein [Isosphaeraceae bacterium]
MISTASTMCSIMTRGLATCAHALDDLVFPWSCVVCGAQEKKLQGPFCPQCRAELLAMAQSAGASACPRCALPTGPRVSLAQGCSDCRGRSLGFDAALTMAPYAGTIRDLCLRLKHERDAWLAPWLGDLLAEARTAELARLPRDTWIAPVPLHWFRRLQRGYNQSEALALGLSKRLGLPIHPPLKRVRATDRLAHQKASKRIAAMRNAFSARAGLCLEGRTILLVDDILTTGATAGAAARALKKAGAKRVVAVVLGRTV